MSPALKSASEDKTEIPSLRAIVIAGQAIHVPYRQGERYRKALRGKEEGRTGPAGAFKQKGTVSLWKSAFATLSTYFLMCRTGFLVILQYSQN
jgi:hypothetical protein